MRSVSQLPGLQALPRLSFVGCGEQSQNCRTDESVCLRYPQSAVKQCPHPSFLAAVFTGRFAKFFRKAVPMLGKSFVASSR